MTLVFWNVFIAQGSIQDGGYTKDIFFEYLKFLKMAISNEKISTISIYSGFTVSLLPCLLFSRNQMSHEEGSGLKLCSVVLTELSCHL